ncbi:MAG TPA: SAM-dependent DNA methyltransferase [Candidatus Tenderia sp.]|nr:SAM-dependent DNA methyltransferase [Candidatus Tenderia sp.]
MHINIAQTYNRIRQLASQFARFVQQAMVRSHNEAEFERQVNNEIERLSRQLDVNLLFREQYTLATGRADAVYNRFVIEYEPPGSLRPNLSHGHTAHAVQQVKDYIVGLAKAEKHDRDRLLGVAFDGHYFIFVRYHQGHWVVEEPLEVNEASCERFLRSLFSLSSGRALIPENLVEDFGNQNVLSQQVTRALYNVLDGHTDDLTARLFEQWKLFFGETAGADAAAGELKHKKELRAFARGMGLRGEQVDMSRFLFALHTYFSFLVKNIARLVLQAYASGGLGATPLTTIANLQGEALRRELRNLESGGLFRALGLKNLLEGDFFAWYLDAWNPDIETALRQVLARLAEYNPVTVQDDPYSARDLLKKLYHYLLPRDIRHDLGEFYTPDWLAERLLNMLGEPWFTMPGGNRPPKGLPDKRLLDPACGSGTFLVLAIRGLKANCVLAGLAEADTLEVILNNVVGIDLNPLAVMAARVNYLLAVADLLPYRRSEVEIPVYLADSILTPARGEGLFAQHRRILETAVGPLPVPEVIDTRAEMERLTDLLEEYVVGDFTTEAFLARCKQEIPDLAETEQADEVLSELYEKLCHLHRQGLDGIWARVLKNAFMPLFLEPFDYVVGNPPWINWESLPQAYREQTAELWGRYGLFVHSGMDTILGKGKKDASTLMTYAVADRFLKEGGKLGFLITQSVWKTGAGQGFRRFRIGESGPFLRVLHVDDLSSLQVFEGASTRTSIFVLQKGQPTRYPVPYTYWKKTTRGKGLDYDSTLDEVLAQTKRLQFYATPVDADDPTSPWLTARRKALDAVRKVLGRSDYQAHAGACTWANAVYWLEILAERPDGLLVVRNVTEAAKRKVEAITTELEPDLVYPLLRGRDVQRWYAIPSLHILMVQDPKIRRGVDADVLQQRYPKTWAYLKRFERPLRERSGFKRYFTRKDKRGRSIETGPFYSMFNVGDYTFAPWKVVWGRIGNRIESAVVSNVAGKPIIPQETISLVACDNQEEAHYIATTINSTPFQFAAYSYSQAGGKSFGSPHVLENIRIPRFNPNDTIHSALSQLSRRAHALASRAYNGDEAAQAELKRVEAEIDRAAARLWGLTEEELREILASLKELRG